MFNPHSATRQFNVNHDVLTFGHTLFAHPTSFSQTFDGAAEAVILLDRADAVS